jgi:hypothetical protein
MVIALLGKQCTRQLSQHVGIFTRRMFSEPGGWSALFLDVTLAWTVSDNRKIKHHLTFPLLMHSKLAGSEVLLLGG